MRAVKSVSIDSERRVIITFLDGSTETLYPNCIWCDSEALRQLIKDLLEEKADAIVQTINNVTIASFADGADEALIKKLLVSIDPIQEGTGDPSPENVRPISGRTGLSVVRSGKNLLDTSTVSSGKGLTITKNADGSIHVEGTPTGTWIDFSSVYNVYIPAGNYTLSLQSEIPCNFVLSSFYENDANRNTNTITNGNKSKSVSFGSNVDRIYIGLSGLNTSTAYDFTIYPQLEIGSTATDYEPYKGITYSVNWETEAGTVYGGTLDVVSGKLTVDRTKITFDGSQTVKAANWRPFDDSSAWLYGPETTPGIYNVINSLDIVCDKLKSIPYEYSSGGIYGDNIGIGMVGTSAYAIGMRVPVAELTTTVLINAWLTENPITVVYKLATPVEYQLTPQEITTLLGENNIWADSGDILELEYVADTKLYIGESQSSTLGSGRQTISNTDLQPVSEKTWEELSEAYKAETEEKETQEETEDERGE